MNARYFGTAFLAGLLFALPLSAMAVSAAITEIMYDLAGTDTDREWIEVHNTGSESISFADWKFVEGNTNHGLVLSRGTATTPAGGFAVIADDPAKFLLDWPSFSGTLFDSSFSLGNGGETLSLKFGDTVVDTVTYASTTGAAGDGNSLQKTGANWQALAPTPGAVSSGAPSAPPSQGDSSGGSTGTSAPPPASSGAPDTPLVIHMTVKAVAPKSAPVGADVYFKGSAYGAKSEPLQNAKFIWTFGDGGTYEGKNVSHVYHFAGRYAVLLSAASGEWSATDRVEILVVEPALSISRVLEGEDGFIEVRNAGSVELDVSGFMLKSGAVTFAIPEGTILLAGNTTAYPGAVTRLLANLDDTVLLFPSGKEVARYVPIVSPPATPPSPVQAAVSQKPVVVTVKAEVKKAEPIPTLPVVEAAVASSSLLIAALGANDSSGFSIPLLALAGLLIISIAGYVFVIRTPRASETPADKLRQEAEEYTFIE